MKFRKATKLDQEKLLTLYHDVIEQQKYDEFGASWTKGVYPTDADILSHLEKGEMFIGEENNVLACCCAVVAGEDEIYKNADWITEVNNNEIAVLHLLVVNKDFRRKGLATEFLNYIKTELERCFKVIHLDALITNLPADRLYRKFGFICIGQYPVWYEDIGNTEVFLYEYRL